MTWDDEVDEGYARANEAAFAAQEAAYRRVWLSEWHTPTQAEREDLFRGLGPKEER